MSLEELMQVEITSVSRKSQRAAEAAAAIYVISHDDIRRSGVTSIPEALRLAPGIQVARIDSNKWAISSRGFNGRFANKLLVLMDGRSVYSPTFSGVYWEVQDTLLEDIERIEVIRGPGAAMWGSNAVNGVINIITKSANDTQGGTVTAGAGTYEKRFGSLRYGTRLGENTYGRAYVKGLHRGDFDATDRTSSNDSWDAVRGGFRVNSEDTAGNKLTLQGDIYRGDLHQGLMLPDPVNTPMAYNVSRGNFSGMNLMGRWQKSLSLTSDLSVQAYYDHTYRNEVFLTEERDTLDIDTQHRFRLTDSQDVVWGLAYRWSLDKYANQFPVTFNVAHRYRQLFSGFLQDEVSVVPDRLKLTIGARLEHNDYTGFEGQPNIRLAWTPSNQHTLWTAVSRAVRIPSRVEDSATLTSYYLAPNNPYLPLPFLVHVMGKGQQGFRSEVLWAFEAGYRFMPTDSFSADLAVFYNDYDKIRSNEAPILAPDLRSATVPFGNNLQGNTYGAELSLDWKPETWMRLQLNYSYLEMDLRSVNGSVDMAGASIPGASPQQQVSFRSAFTLRDSVDLDMWVRYVDALPTAGFPNPSLTQGIPSYVTLDTRISWRPISSLEFSIVGQNLLDSRHPEFLQELYAPKMTEIPRSVYFQINAKF